MISLQQHNNKTESFQSVSCDKVSQLASFSQFGVVFSTDRHYGLWIWLVRICSNMVRIVYVERIQQNLFTFARFEQLIWMWRLDSSTVLSSLLIRSAHFFVNIIFMQTNMKNVQNQNCWWLDNYLEIFLGPIQWNTSI